METAVYQQILASTSQLKPSLSKGLGVLLYVSVNTTIALYLSFSDITALWFLGQMLFGITVLQWFILMHDFGHNYFFKNSYLNWFFGYWCSIICLVPFAPWKWIHSQHHTWTGWHDLDPTQESTQPSKSSFLKNKLANWSWKLGIPTLTLAFSFKNFWNLPRLFRLFKEPSKRMHFIFSVTFPILVIVSLIYFVPGFWHAWALGYLFFLILSDPLLLSQHVHIPQKFSDGASVAPFSVKEQDQFTRTLIVPDWVSKFVLLAFDKHTLHHVVPRLACYHLNTIQCSFKTSIHWMEWLIKAKNIPAEKLLFSNNNETGLNL